MTTIYHNPRCRKSRDGVAILENMNIPFKTRLYLDEPLSKVELVSLLSLLKLPAKELLRTQEAVYKQTYKGKELTEEEAIEAMVLHPKLIERPIVVNGKNAVIGRPPENIHALFDQ